MDTSCFARVGNKCAVLRVGKAHCEGCRFRKSVYQAALDLERAFERIAAKPAAQQNAIAKKYYGGKMPWKED